MNVGILDRDRFPVAFRCRGRGDGREESDLIRARDLNPNLNEFHDRLLKDGIGKDGEAIACEYEGATATREGGKLNSLVLLQL